MSEFVTRDDPAIACPCCGQAEWKYLEEHLLLLIARESDGGAATEGEDPSGIVTAAFLCQHCRFVRLQALDGS